MGTATSAYLIFHEANTDVPCLSLWDSRTWLNIPSTAEFEVSDVILRTLLPLQVLRVKPWASNMQDEFSALGSTLVPLWYLCPHIM